jgi:glutamyl-tRNA reductase
VLSRLFQTAIHAGKRARTETRISRDSASVSSLAASLAAQAVENLPDAQIVILGAGEMAELAAEALRKRGAARFLVVNRTLKRAQALSSRWQGEATTFEHLESALERADILIASTGAPHMIVHPRMVTQAMQARPSRALVMIDIAVPRDIDPRVRATPGVRLYDIDQLNSQIEDSLARRQAEIPHVRRILAEELEAFDAYLASLEILPLIAALRQQAEAIRQAEVEKTLRRLSHLDARDHQRIEALSRALVKKLIDAPIRRLRIESSNGHAPEYARAARALFDIPENTPS